MGEITDEKIKEPRAAAVARLAANHYARITWRQPGRSVDKEDGKSKASGGFVYLLKIIFRALGIKASVELHAKRAAHEFKQPSALSPFGEQFPHEDRLRQNMDSDERKLDK
jgi:hypothetical protein